MMLAWTISPAAAGLFPALGRHCQIIAALMRLGWIAQSSREMVRRNSLAAANLGPDTVALFIEHSSEI
jgi:hypothetical protein